MIADREEELNFMGAWSDSALGALGECGRKYWYMYKQKGVERARTASIVGGSITHRIIDKMHKVNDFSPAFWTSELKTQWDKQSKTVDWDKEKVKKATWEKLVSEMIANYVTANRKVKVQASEWAFPNKKGEKFFIGDHEIKGIVDQIRPNFTGQAPITIVDFKTSKKEPDPLLLRTDPQFTFYWEAVRQRYGVEADIIWYHLRNGKLIRTERTAKDVEMVREMLDEAQVKVDQKMFARHVGFHCNWCPFINDCLGPFGIKEEE